MTTDTPATEPNPYVAVVYFHGMGSQRRYEECSRLIDSIDSYLSNEYRERDNPRGFVRKITPRIEPHRARDGETVTYIRTKYFAPDGAGADDQKPKQVRFYESYWAPVMAATSSPRTVAMWILRQSIRPWQTLSTAWRERQRLRRSALADLESDKAAWPAATEVADFDTLLQAYAAFDGLDAKRDFRAGNFTEFKTFLARENAGEPATLRRLEALADQWRRYYVKRELANAFVILTILLALALTGGLLIWSMLQVLQLISGWEIMQKDTFVFSSFLSDKLDPSVTTAAGLVVSVLLALGLGRFLSDYMGDVQAYATYEETDEKHQKRRRVIELGSDLLKHVLADKHCERVMVVAHSLGTSVAHDTLLSLARDNRSTNPSDPIKGPIKLKKIRHFVTMGSPIDKINYFFESFRSVSHRYTRVVETLRGDISDVPFARNQKPYVHWVNFWDEADIISGSLQSPVGRTTLSQKVDNVHVANLHFPSPATSHSAYFNHRKVIARIFEMAYLDEYDYGKLPLVEGKGYDYDQARIGPGEDLGHSRWFMILAAAVPWIGLVFLVLKLSGAEAVASFTLWMLIALAIALAGAAIMQKSRGHRLPI